VAEQSGVSSSLLDKSLGAFTKRLGEAKAGTGPLAQALKRMNPQLLNQLNNTDSVANAFDIYMKAIRGAQTATERAALANAAFSRSGLDLVNIANNSADAIDALRLEQRENGLISQQAAEAAEAYNDAVNSLKRSIGGLIQNALLPILPKITENVRAVRDWVVQNRELISGRVTEYVLRFRDSIKKLIEQVREYNRENNLVEQIENLVRALMSAVSFVQRHGETILKFAAAIVVLTGALKALSVILGIVNLVMAANPIVLIALGVIAATAAIVGLVTWLWKMGGAYRKVAVAILAFMGPVGWMIGAAMLIVKNWDKVKVFFANLWDGIVSGFDKIKPIIDKILSVPEALSNVGGRIGGFFGFGRDDDAEVPDTGSQGQSVVSPQERTARSIEERNTTSSSEVTLRTEPGTSASVTRGELGRGVKLQPTGAF